MKKGLVIQAKFLEEWVTPDKKTFYIFGVRIKYEENGKFMVDAGRYYSTTKEQSVFKEGIDCEYEIDINAEKPKESKIRVPKKASSNNYEKLGIKEYMQRAVIESVGFSASYAKDMCVANVKLEYVATADMILQWQLQQFKDLK